MKVEIKIERDIKEPKLVLYTDAMTPELTQLVGRLSGDTKDIIIGFIDSEAFLLSRQEIFRFYVEEQKVYARCETKAYRIKSRIYELEELLSGTAFVRISNSEIANFNKVASLDMGISGTITVRFKNGETAYVSRRYVEKIKNYLGL